MKRTLLVLALSAAASAAIAQSHEPFYGNWKVGWVDGNGKTQEAKLQIGKEASSWQTSALRNKENPCIGLKAPVTLEPQTDSEATVALKFSEAVAGCQDVKLQMKLLSATTATGKRGRFDLDMKKE